MKNITLLFVIFICFSKCYAQDNSERPPNIIFILIDDQRYDFLSYLEHSWIKTPNIDKLASNSTYFDNAFVTTSLCSPSRASIMTGQYTRKHKVWDNDTPLPNATVTFPEALQEQGYITSFIGKWHMGGDNDMPRAGFDQWISFKGQGAYVDPMVNVDGKRVQRKGYMTDILTDYAVAFIQENANSEQPYFMYLSHKAIHEDFTPAPRHAGVYNNLIVPRPESMADTDQNYLGKPDWVRKQRRSWHGTERDFKASGYIDFDNFFRRYSEAMLSVDESVGKLTEELVRLCQLENTVIIYYSDNGYMVGEHGLIDKRVMYEESIRVPGFVHWPGKLKKPMHRKEIVLNIDIAPTILDIAKADIPKSMHGTSFLPLLENQPISWREGFIYEYFCDPKAVQTPTIVGLRTNEYSYMAYSGIWDNYELYHLQNDPGQRKNLLGHIKFGHDYGTFLDQVERQDTELFKIVSSLDDEMQKLLNKN
ncbi:MAG: sulfatase [Bacteroidota bacterium]